MTEVVQERAAAGVGVVFSSHQLDLVEDVCEDVVIIARGRIVAAGAIDELRAASGRRHLDVEVAGTDGAWLDGAWRPHACSHATATVKLPVDARLDLSACWRRPRRPARSAASPSIRHRLSEPFDAKPSRITALGSGGAR